MNVHTKRGLATVYVAQYADVEVQDGTHFAIRGAHSTGLATTPVLG